MGSAADPARNRALSTTSRAFALRPSFPVWPTAVWARHRATSIGQSTIELGSEHDSQRHVLLRLIGGIAEHDTLVTCTMVLEGALVKTLCNIRRLLLNCDEDVAGLVVEALFRVIVTDVLDGVADDLLEIDLGLCSDLAKHHDHASLRGRLACDLGEGILLKASIELLFRGLASEFC